mmetsp:Transcript_36408/g.54370  ORF Transcript_36408/g.54370 Transcript_36408/m.54370 type:complete len:86 (-) Transcript_36408:57-314(-)
MPISSPLSFSAPLLLDIAQAFASGRSWCFINQLIRSPHLKGESPDSFKASEVQVSGHPQSNAETLTVWNRATAVTSTRRIVILAP